MDQVRILFFASFRDLVGQKEIFLQLEAGTTVKVLIKKLEETYPAIKNCGKKMLVSINHEFSSTEQEIPINAEVAIFPPVSGG